MDATRFLASVKRRAYLPDAGTEFDDSAILDIANEAESEVLTPMMLVARESYLQRTDTFSASANLERIQIPPRSIGNSVSTVRYLDPSGILNPLTHIDDAQKVWSAQIASPVSPFTVWYFDGQEIVFQPKLPPGGTAGASFLVTYAARPNYLSTSTVIQRITGFGTISLGQISVVDVTGYAKGDVVDVVAYTGGHEWKVFGSTILNISGIGPYVVTLDGVTANNGILIGDWLCPQSTDTPGQWLTPIPMLPDELHPILVLETSRRILDSIGDPRAAALMQELMLKMKTAEGLITPRAQNAPKHIVNRMSSFRVRRNPTWGGGWWW